MIEAFVIERGSPRFSGGYVTEVVRDLQKHWHTLPLTAQQPMQSVGRMFRQNQKLPAWTLAAVALLILLSLNWQLVVATGLGVIIMLVTYAAQGWKWHSLFLQVQKFINSPNRRLIVAVGMGAATVLGTYMIFAIWSETANHWLASVSIMQFVATLSVFILLVKQVIGQWLQETQTQFDRLVLQLTASNDLERLIAVRQLAQCVQQNSLLIAQEQAIAQYCQVLLDRELVSAVREAALETLEALNYKATILPTKQSAIKPQHRV